MFLGEVSLRILFCFEIYVILIFSIWTELVKTSKMQNCTIVNNWKELKEITFKLEFYFSFQRVLEKK